jgi:predicted AAA+ superfamily ATPase
MGACLPAETLRRFWTMLAHVQGQLFNASQLGVALGGAAHTTVARYLDLLVDTLRVFVLAPVPRRYPLSEKMDVLPVWDVAQALPDAG